MAGADRLLDYYERELAYLRTAGKAFAADHPTVARRLALSADESPDPHVERLLEAFAFLAARIHQNIDDSTSEVANNLLEQLYPHALRPVPSATIACFDAASTKVNLDAGYAVLRGAPLFTHSSEGDTVYFQTCYPVTLWPLRITGVTLHSGQADSSGAPPATRSELRLRLTYPNGFAFPAGAPAPLRFYVKGAGDASARLCDLLLGSTVAVIWRRAGNNSTAEVLEARPSVVGLDADEALLPERSDTHPAFRLLVEYFAFPAKFQFFDLDCSELTFEPKAGDAAPGQLCEGELVFKFDRPLQRQLVLENDAVRLGCTPVINLFPRSAEPLRITGRQAYYKLVADHHRHRSTEIYAIERVQGVGPAGAADLPAYFAFRPASAPDGGGGQCWHARRINSTTPGLAGSDMQLTFVDPDFKPDSKTAAHTLNARVLCTNRHLAGELNAGAELYIEDAAAFSGIVALHKPTVQVQPSLDGAARWKLASQLALNQMTLVDTKRAGAALQEMLALNNLTQELEAQRQIKGLQLQRCERVTRYIDQHPWSSYRQGYRVTVRLDDQQFRYSSKMLFCAVLRRFLALFAGINTFVELTLEDDDGREVHTWPALPASYVSV